ncbi:extracellular calcium-sensing receptor-like, partial [Arapaima gigas]
MQSSLFLYHRHVLMLVLSKLIFVNQPTPWSCKAQHLAFIISFVAWLICVQVNKTVVMVLIYGTKSVSCTYQSLTPH